MTSWGVPMRDTEGEGERAEKARNRRFWTTLIVLALAGAVVGGIMSVLTDGDLSGPLPAGWAVAAALIYAAAVIGGSWYFFRTIDEVEMRDNLWAATVAVYFYSLVYPVWYLFWKGSLVPEPGHELIFIATMVVMTSAYLGKKIRP
jgi:hypothetical protein